MKKFLLIVMSLLLLWCSKEKNNEIIDNIWTLENTKQIEQIDDKEIINTIFEVYCNISTIKKLYSIAPDTEYYKSFVENNSDVSSQKIIAPILIAKRDILKQDKLLNILNSNSWSYQNSIELLIKSDNNILTFLENMKNIESFNDFKDNMTYLIIWIELFNSIPTEFWKEYIPNNDDAWSLIINWDIMCNNDNWNISFWEDRYNK